MHQLHQAIGILGGTFDPIHIGHLRMAIELYELLKLSKVHIIPSYQPVHRDQPLASSSQRLAMVRCAVASEPTLYADPREIERQQPSYMIDTLVQMRKEMPDTPFCLLVGMDAFLDFPTWHRFDEIPQFAHIVVAHRPSFQLSSNDILTQIMSQYMQSEIDYIHHHLAGGIFQLPIPGLDIAAANIRKQIAMGKNPRYLLPEGVYDYIQQHGIYQK